MEQSSLTKGASAAETVYLGTPEDIPNWMALVESVRNLFPGLDTPEQLEKHKNTVLRFMERREAICTKYEEKITGTLLFSREQNIICFLAVSAEYRRRGIGAALLTQALYFCKQILLYFL